MGSKNEMQVLVSEACVSWTIENFILNACSPSGRCVPLRSQVFSVAGKDCLKWYLKLYPFDYHNKIKDTTTIFLIQMSNERNHEEPFVKINFYNNEGECLKETLFSSCLERSVRRDELTLLNNGSLIIKCWIRWDADRNAFKEASDNNKINISSKLLESYNLLGKEDTFSDVKLVANDGTEFPVHRCILALRSPVFTAMFRYNMRENQESVVKIEDFDGKTLKAVLQFIYSNEIEEADCDIVEVFVAADKYALDFLRELCEVQLCANLTVENAATHLSLADLYSSSTLMSQSLNFIKEHIRDVMKTESFKNLKKTQPHLLEKILLTVFKEEI